MNRKTVEALLIKTLILAGEIGDLNKSQSSAEYLSLSQEQSEIIANNQSRSNHYDKHKHRY